MPEATPQAFLLAWPRMALGCPTQRMRWAAGPPGDVLVSAERRARRPDTETVHGGNNSHGVGLNFQSVHGRQTDHVEFRMWDSSLDPGVIQAQVKLSLGMAHAAFRSMGERWGTREPVGTHRQRNAPPPRGRRLRGAAWRADTASFRRLVDRVFSRDEDKAQATALFAVTRWQRPG